MARRARNPLFSRSLQRSLTRTFGAITRTLVRAGARAIRKPVTRRKPATPLKPASRTLSVATAALRPGVVIGASGARRYQLYKPPGAKRGERFPLVVMLHGCTQDARAFAASSRMDSIAARERFMVLYPQQDRMANAQGCWNWFDTRNGRAQREADAIGAAISQVCLTQPVDANRIAVAGFSAGAGMAALLATRQPGRFKAVVMHSGIGPGVAHSPATALSAMRGRRGGAALLPQPDDGPLPALLVIQGTADPVVARSNGASAAQRWAAHASEQLDAGMGDKAGAESGAKSGAGSIAKVAAKSSLKAKQPRTVQRGKRRSATVTDFRVGGRGGARIVATLCEVNGLGHAWSGGAPGLPYSDPTGPDASRMVWAFAARQFASALTSRLHFGNVRCPIGGVNGYLDET